MSLIPAFTEAYRLLEKTDIKTETYHFVLKCGGKRSTGCYVHNWGPNGEGIMECPP